MRQHIDATLGSGNLREAVLLPPGEDLNEWLAVNTVDFYNAISVLYGTLAEYCVDATCPAMCAGPKYEYRWADGVAIHGRPNGLLRGCARRGCVFLRLRFGLVKAWRRRQRVRRLSVRDTAFGQLELGPAHGDHRPWKPL